MADPDIGREKLRGIIDESIRREGGTGAHRYSRRMFLALAAAGTVAGPWAKRSSAASLEAIGAVRTLRLTTSGGDRATGYVMSNKIARRDGHLLCTWLDVERNNQWALVDRARRDVLRTGTVGERRQDNHCGAALATDADGTLHLLIGAHHGRFVHYRWPMKKHDWKTMYSDRSRSERLLLDFDLDFRLNLGLQL